jgi:phosphatidylinositol alpha 1,6-mannosyltransferase
MIVTESFLPSINGVTGSVLRVLEHLRRQNHTALVVAPEGGPSAHEGTPVVRVPAVSIPGVSELPVGLPTRRLQEVMAGFRPDVVHLASPFVLGAGGLAAARRLGVPTVAVYQTDLARFVRAYGAGVTARTASAIWSHPVRPTRYGPRSRICATTRCCGTPSAAPGAGPCAGGPGRWSATS